MCQNRPRRAYFIIKNSVALCLSIVIGSSSAALAQSWMAEKRRIQAEAKAIVEQLQKEPDGARFAKEVSRLTREYLDKVTKPQLTAARTCEARMTAIADALTFLQMAQALGIETPETTSLYMDVMTGAYADQGYERCMNEMYRRCVLDDDPRYVPIMVGWVIGHERMKMLMGRETKPLDLTSELDSRITKCRGPWYKVRLVFERSGTDPDTGRWYQTDVSEGWMGRGLNSGDRSDYDRHPGDFTRRAEALSHGSVCPDGGCGEICHFLAVRTGPARVSYELENRFVDDFRQFPVGFLEDQMTETFERNTCGHTDLPDMFHPGTFYETRLPGTFPPLPETLEDAADVRVTEQLDEWPRLFGPGGTTLELGGGETGRLEVLTVCDGQELWGKGSSECQQKWQEYLVFVGGDGPGVLGPHRSGPGPGKKD